MTGTIAGFTSTGIDDNATSTAITIDASENVLVGKTSQNIGTVGFEATPSSSFQANASTANGKVTHTFNRLTSDGDIATFRKDGATFGSIGVSGGNNLYISGQATSHAGLTFATQSVLPTTQGTINNNTVDLGQSGNAFKDLYLSGNVVVASGKGIDFSATSDGSGTMTSEVLDDYETGTWTPTLLGSTTNPTYTGTIVGTYVKVGKQVTLTFRIYTTNQASGSGTIHIGGLPFNILGGSYKQHLNLGYSGAASSAGAISPTTGDQAHSTPRLQANALTELTAYGTNRDSWHSSMQIAATGTLIIN
jgi:hypothetical protein